MIIRCVFFVCEMENSDDCAKQNCFTCVCMFLSWAYINFPCSVRKQKSIKTEICSMNVDIRWQAVNEHLWKRISSPTVTAPNKNIHFIVPVPNIAQKIMPQFYSSTLWNGKPNVKSMASQTVVVALMESVSKRQGQMHFNGMHASLNGHNVNLMVFASV